MRQLLLDGPHQLRVVEVDSSPPGAGEVRVRVHSTGVCGSDIHGYAGVNTRRVAGMVMGHEAVGSIEELGVGVSGMSVGDPVAINPVIACGQCDLCAAGLENICERRRLYGCVPGLAGAFADSVVVRAENAVAFQTDVPLEWGALVEPFAVGWHAVEVASIEGEDRVLIVGGGPIGLGAALVARQRGARRILVSEPNAHRREVASALGLETADPRIEPPAPSSFDVAFECVGLTATLATALNSVRPRGEVVFVGLAEETIALPATQLMVGERRLLGSSAYTTADFEATARWIASGTTDLSSVIELRVDLDQMSDVFARYADGSLNAMKAVFQP